MSGVILCALDIDEPQHEEKVLRRAAQIADLDGARLDVITIVPNYGSSMVSTYFTRDFHKRAVATARSALSAFCENVLGKERNGDVRHMVDTGKVYEQVLKAAGKLGATVIVIGSHRPELQDYLLGPNAARVVRHANCSVFVVR